MRVAMTLGVAVVLPLLAAAVHPRAMVAGVRIAERTVWDSVYTADQAQRGQTAYNQTCARCHQPTLGGADQSPALVGGAFLGNWNGLTLGALHERIRKTMPSDDPGTYGRQHIADVMAYVLKVNGFPAGSVELPKESDALEQIRLQAARP
jgi:mono/diheme cytochrome c family protein